MAKKGELLQLTRRLTVEVPSHDSLFLLQILLAVPRLMYQLLWFCSDSPKLPLNDADDSLSATQNIDDNRRIQASLPIRLDGLGVHADIFADPPAYLATAASTVELTYALLPLHRRTIEDSGVASAMSAWIRQASSQTASISTPSPPPSTTVHGMTSAGRRSGGCRSRAEKTAEVSEPKCMLALNLFPSPLR